ALEGIAGTAPRPGNRPSGCFFAPRSELAVDVCHAEFPPVARVADGHVVRCHRYEEVLAAAARARTPAHELPAPEPAALIEVRNLDAAHSGRQVLFGIDPPLPA